MAQSIRWAPSRSVGMCHAPFQAAPGVYVAAAYHNGGLIPGVVTANNVCLIPFGGGAVSKTDYFVHPSHKVCYVPHMGREISNASYDVLCLKTIPLASLGLQSPPDSKSQKDCKVQWINFNNCNEKKNMYKSRDNVWIITSQMCYTQIITLVWLCIPKWIT